MKIKINEIKTFLRMQMLAGVISESKYIKLLEDITVVDRILDKISSQGIESLNPEEKEYLDAYSKGKKILPASGATTIYVGEPYGELYKIENFPALPNAENVHFTCEDAKDASTCEGYAEMMELISNKNFKLILDKIHNNELSLQYEPLYFHGIEFDGDFSSPIDVAYAQVAGDGFLYIVDSLSRFNFEYQTEEGWGIRDWKKL